LKKLRNKLFTTSADALLRRSVGKERNKESRKPILGHAMEYAGAVSTMVYNQMADNNKKMEVVFGKVMNRIKQEVTRVNEMEVRLQEAEEAIATLVTGIHKKAHTIDLLEQTIKRIEGLIDVLWECLDSHHLTFCVHWGQMDLMERGGDRGNPIVMSDDETVEEEEEEESSEEEGSLSGSDSRALQGPGVPGRIWPVRGRMATPHRLVPIEDLAPSEAEEDSKVETEVAVAIVALNPAPVYPGNPPSYTE